MQNDDKRTCAARRTSVWGRTLLITVAVAVLVLGVPVGRAQPVERNAGDTANLFVSLDPSRAADGVRLTTPSTWKIDDVHLLRYGTEPVPVRLDRRSPTTVDALATEPLRRPHELVVQVRLPEQTGRQVWSWQPLKRDRGAPPDAPVTLQTGGKRTQRVEVQRPSIPDTSNHVFSWEEAEGPLTLRADALPSFGPGAPFTVSFWMQTTGLNEVVLSTWNGDEASPYPVEFVVDRGGRLRVYNGRPGRHEGLWTESPVADGDWHHVALAYDPDRSRLRLLLDGLAVDSLQHHRIPAPPGPVEMALGGRVPAGPLSSTEDHLYSGRIDEVLVWGHARSIAAVRRDMQSPLGPTDGPRLRLDADTWDGGLGSTIEQRPSGMRRVPSTRSTQPPIRDLHAQTDGRSVTLRWRAPAAEASSFIVERSTDRQSFQVVGEIDANRAVRRDEAPYTYTDASVPDRVVYYRIRVERDGRAPQQSAMVKVGVGTDDEEAARVELVGNFPNPFTETTTIEYEVREPATVTLTIWTLTGTRVRTLADGHHERGTYEQTFDASSLPSGSYFARLQTPDGVQSRRMTLLR